MINILLVVVVILILTLATYTVRKNEEEVNAYYQKSRTFNDKWCNHKAIVVITDVNGDTHHLTHVYNENDWIYGMTYESPPTAQQLKEKLTYARVVKTDDNTYIKSLNILSWRILDA